MIYTDSMCPEMKGKHYLLSFMFVQIIIVQAIEEYWGVLVVYWLKRWTAES